MNGWIGVDLDATLARYDGWKGPTVIGDPIPAMVERVKQWRREGRDVRIFTARVWAPSEEDLRAADTATGYEAMRARQREVIAARFAIRQWCVDNIGEPLPITCQKDLACMEIWDDRAVQVIPNSGIAIRDTTQVRAA